jgi:hypothetical protein
MPLLYPSFAENYIRLAGGNNPLEIFRQHQSAIHQYIHPFLQKKLLFGMHPKNGRCRK